MPKQKRPFQVEIEAKLTVSGSTEEGLELLEGDGLGPGRPARGRLAPGGARGPTAGEAATQA